MESTYRSSGPRTIPSTGKRRAGDHPVAGACCRHSLRTPLSVTIPSLLWNADCMVLPTAGENYGHVIAESCRRDALS